MLVGMRSVPPVHVSIDNCLTEEAINKMRERLAEGYAVDIQVGEYSYPFPASSLTSSLNQDLMSRFTLDSATEFLFGSCVHSLATVLPYPFHAPSSLTQRESSPAEDFALAFTQAQDAVNFRVRMGPYIWPWFELFGSKTKGPMRVVDAFLDPILKAAVEKARVEKTLGTATSNDSKEEIGEDDTLLDHLVKYTDGGYIVVRRPMNNSQLTLVLDPKVLHDEVLNIMIAGRDTVSGFSPRTCITIISLYLIVVT